MPRNLISVVVCWSISLACLCPCAGLYPDMRVAGGYSLGMSTKIKYAAGAALLVGAGTMAYRRYQNDDDAAWYQPEQQDQQTDTKQQQDQQEEQE